MNGFVIADPDKCIGCHTCEVACVVAHSGNNMFLQEESGADFYPRLTVVETDEVTAYRCSADIARMLLVLMCALMGPLRAKTTAFSSIRIAALVARPVCWYVLMGRLRWFRHIKVAKSNFNPGFVPILRVHGAARRESLRTNVICVKTAARARNVCGYAPQMLSNLSFQARLRIPFPGKDWPVRSHCSSSAVFRASNSVTITQKARWSVCPISWSITLVVYIIMYVSPLLSAATWAVSIAIRAE